MILQKEVHGIFATNSYFYIDNETRHGFLIDPGAQADELLKIIEQENFTIEKILLTHGHFDHIGAIPELQARLNVEVCMQKNVGDYVKVWNLSAYFGLDMTLDDVNYLDDFSRITLTTNKNFGVELIPLAGHTTDGAMWFNR